MEADRVTHIAPEVWSRLSNEKATGESLWARRAMPDVSERLLAALDTGGIRHLLILLTDAEPDIHDQQSRGIAVETRELAVPGHEPGRYMDITCVDDAGRDAFNIIGGEIVERLASGRETAPDVVTRVLSKWRRFWGQFPLQILSRERQLGLFAEVWFLSFWLIRITGRGEAVRRWRGPLGARHDFEWPGRSVEVKATTSIRGRIHHINGLEQLALPELGTLLLFSLRVREEGGATNTLPSVVASCRSALSPDGDALSRFEGLLTQAGYSVTHEDEYAKLRVRVLDEGLFRVEDDFPRVTEDSFPNGVPNGVDRVEYEINLDVCSHLLIARSADSLTGL